MKKNLLFVLALIACFNLFSKSVSQEKAQALATGFFKNYFPSVSKANCYLAYQSQSNAYSNSSSSTPENYFYVFNYQNKGFVILSADDVFTPIIAFSLENGFTADNMAQHVQKWLEGYKEEIRAGIKNGLESTMAINNEWKNLENGLLIGVEKTGNTNPKRGSVSPLLTTKWNQSPNYNALCPYDNGARQLTVSGCVATAVTQVMKYWNYPAKGTGNYSYNHSNYGTLSANFAATTYNWSNMPNTVNSGNFQSVALLTYQVGVSVDMNYGIASTGGSGAYVISSKSPVTNCAEYALKTYFGYKTTLKGVERASYNATNWINLLKAELDASRPIIYAGFGSGGGHCFVADGYDNNNFFHFNWGWGGNSDGYFSINALNPGSLGAGGGSGGFNSGHQAIIGVEPKEGGTSASTMDMRLYSEITLNQSPVNYNTNFSVNVRLANFGTTSQQNFQGDFAAAIFNSSNQFVSFVETKAISLLEFNFFDTYTFSTQALSNLVPGTYKMGMYYRIKNTTDWKAFSNNGGYSNFQSFDVKGLNINPLKLYAAIATTPSPIVQNNSFVISFDIANFDNRDFNGDVSVDLHRADGTHLRELGIKTGLSLQAGYHFTNGLQYTISSGLADEPGNYLLFVYSKPSGGIWDYVGTGNFANPVSILVAAPSLNPDIYENNNTVSTPYTLPVSYVNNKATVKTTGSNCHIGTDYDFYKINFPVGTNYAFSAKLNDAFVSDDGKTYTLDAVFSYSLDNGASFSDVFDTRMGETMISKGGSNVIFKVSPYFTGGIGTYLLDINIDFTQSVSDLAFQNLIKLYPNPAKDFVTVQFDAIKVNSITVMDVQGRIIETYKNLDKENLLLIEQNNLGAGIYFLNIETDKGLVVKKLVFK